MTADPGFEAALFRAYNRYLGAQCQQAPKRLKWSGLLPLRDQRQAFEALEEMQRLGARAAVVFGTAGDRMLSDPSLLPIWDEFAHASREAIRKMISEDKGDVERTKRRIIERMRNAPDRGTGGVLPSRDQASRHCPFLSRRTRRARSGGAKPKYEPNDISED